MLYARCLGKGTIGHHTRRRGAFWRFVQIVGLFAGFGFASSAMAQTAPFVNPNASAVVQGFGSQPDTVNLLARGIIGGSPVLRIVSATVSPDSTVSVLSFNGVCVTFANREDNATGTLIVVLENSVGTSDALNIPITQGSVDDEQASCMDTRLPPTVTIEGGNRIVPDTDQSPGELVTVTGTAFDADGTVNVSTFRWTINGEPFPQADGQQSPTFFLQDGANFIELTAVDNDGAVGFAFATITVTAPGQTPEQSPPNAIIAGGNRFVPDSDGEPGEDVTFAGSANDADGTVDVSTFRWYVNDILIEEASGIANPTIRLQDGENQVMLIVTDNDGLDGSTMVIVSVGESSGPQGPGLEDNLENNLSLTPNQRAVARAVDTLCPALGERQQEEGLTDAQTELLVRCSLIIANSESPSEQQEAVRRLSGEQVTGQSSTALDFSRVNLSGLTSRLSALRQGATGISLAGLSILHDGRPIPLETLAQFARSLLGGGASSDEAGSLLGNKLGIFITGRYGRGDHSRTSNESGFDFDAKSLMIGVDYRFTNSLVVGIAASYGESDTDFYDDAGRLDSTNLSGSIYGSWYADKLYIDFLASYGNLDFDQTRRIVYVDAGGTVDQTAVGSTNGSLTTAAFSVGYNLGRKGWTFTPNIAVTGTRMKADAFSETGAFGLDLHFGEQKADSWDVQAGVMLGYVWNQKWGVLTPQVRASYVHQEQDRGEVFVRFVNDPFSSAPGRDLDTGFVIRTDDPDSEFLRWGVSLSAVFKGGVSGFVDYQAFEGMRAISYGEFSAGLRFELPLR